MYIVQLYIYTLILVQLINLCSLMQVNLFESMYHFPLMSIYNLNIDVFWTFWIDLLSIYSIPINLNTVLIFQTLGRMWLMYKSKFQGT